MSDNLTNLTDLESLRAGFLELAKCVRKAKITHEEAATMLEETASEMPVVVARAAMRTQFAAAALTGLNANRAGMSAEDIAQLAWEQAVAMLKNVKVVTS